MSLFVRVVCICIVCMPFHTLYAFSFSHTRYFHFLLTHLLSQISDPSSLSMITIPYTQLYPTTTTDLITCITWMPHGRSWKILNRDLFSTYALPRYFGHTNHASFVRVVNAWGFRRIVTGPDRDSYYHELFLRGKSNLYTQMKRLPNSQKKTPVNKEDKCPDFYELCKTSPLPENVWQYRPQSMNNGSAFSSGGHVGDRMMMGGGPAGPQGFGGGDHHPYGGHHHMSGGMGMGMAHHMMIGGHHHHPRHGGMGMGMHPHHGGRMMGSGMNMGGGGGVGSPGGSEAAAAMVGMHHQQHRSPSQATAAAAAEGLPKESPSEEEGGGGTSSTTGGDKSSTTNNKLTTTEQLLEALRKQQDENASNASKIEKLANQNQLLQELLLKTREAAKKAGITDLP
jgi:hypothetical protein